MLPSEYRECVKSWEEHYISKIKSEYEIARFNSWLSLLPHIKGNKSQLEIFRFDWEKVKTAKIKWQDQRNIKN